MSSQSQRGAVSIVVVIIMGILILAVGALWFTTYQDASKAKEDLNQLRPKVGAGEARLHYAEQAYEALAEAIGPKVPKEMPKPENFARDDFGGTSNSAFAKDPLLLGNKLAEVKAAMKAALDEVGEKDRAPANMQEATENLVNSWKKVMTDVKNTQQDVVVAKDAEIKAAKDKLDAAEKKAAEDLAALNTEKENATARLNQQLTEANSQRDEAQGQNRKLTEEITSTKDTANKEVNTAKAKQRTLDAQVSAIKSGARLQRETDQADGKVLAVNHALKSAWIDLGGKDKLRRGTKFKTFTAIKAGEKTRTGTIVVTDVGPDRSQVAIESEMPGREISESDIIVNPVFDRSRAVHFVFLGEMTGRLNKEAAKAVLEKNGAKVDEKVTVDTDFIVLGMKEAPDAPELTESEAYKQAQAWGIEIIRARDLDPFLTF